MEHKRSRRSIPKDEHIEEKKAPLSQRRRKIQDEIDEELDKLSQEKLSQGPSPKKKRPKKLTFTIEKLLDDNKKNKYKLEVEPVAASPQISPVKPGSLNDSMEMDDSSDSQSKLQQMLLLPSNDFEEKRYLLFSKWPKPLPAPTLHEDENSSNIDDASRLMNSLPSKPHQQQKELVCGGWLIKFFRNGSYRCPNNVLQWLFSLVAYSTDEYFAACAFRTLESLMTGHETQLSSLSGPSNVVKREREDHPDEWSPSYADFLSVFREFGADLSANAVASTPGGSESSSKEPQKYDAVAADPSYRLDKKGFPLSNFLNVVNYLNLCVAHRPKIWKRAHVENLIVLTCRFFIDPFVADAQTHLTRLFETLVSFFSAKRWRDETLSNLCFMLSSRFSDVKAFLPIAKNIPVTVPHGRELQCQISFIFLYMLHGMDTEKIVDRLFWSDSPSRLIELVKLFVGKTDFQKTYIGLSLAMLCLNDRNYVSQYVDRVRILHSLTKDLNLSIREVGGSNLEITRVKDTLSLISAKLSLFAPGKKKKSYIQTTLRPSGSLEVVTGT
eukprot:TRINITY_DN2720_c0_g1_i2.p1 TRINITY_DN2720_c0_g1~~TRINITY_DN2720_c0_g1_i2.p1  ORF type:complete len:554 (+),score=123.38 TRINITY_DN2720_c0_g1_i2:18-1679(+)